MKNLAPLKDAKSIAREPYAWPGGYPRFLVMMDGGSLCPTCVREEFRLICSAVITDSRDGWKPNGADINWEDKELYCDHCGNRIESAYAEE